MDQDDPDDENYSNDTSDERINYVKGGSMKRKSYRTR